MGGRLYLTLAKNLQPAFLQEQRLGLKRRNGNARGCHWVLPICYPKRTLTICNPSNLLNLLVAGVGFEPTTFRL